MLQLVIVLSVIALVLLFRCARRHHTIVYRKKVAPPDRGYSVQDHTTAFGPSATFNYQARHDDGTGHTVHDPLSIEGGAFGGGGAGESYQTETTDHFSGDLKYSEPYMSDFIESNGFDSTANDTWANDSGTYDPGTIDSGTNYADSNNSSFSDGCGYSQDQ